MAKKDKHMDDFNKVSHIWQKHVQGISSKKFVLFFKGYLFSVCLPDTRQRQITETKVDMGVHPRSSRFRSEINSKVGPRGRNSSSQRWTVWNSWTGFKRMMKGQPERQGDRGGKGSQVEERAWSIHRAPSSWCCWGGRGFQSLGGDLCDLKTFEFPNSLCVDRFWNGLKAKREISEHFCPRCTLCCGLGRPSGNQLVWQTW